MQTKRHRFPFAFRRLHRIAAISVLAALPWCSVGAQTVTPEPATPPAEEARFLPSLARHAEDLLMRAMSLIGTPYHRGGRSPEVGFDCSGFVGYLFSEVVNLTLPRSAREIWRVGTPVDADQLEPGDLVFFNTMRRPLSHVGVFIGDGRFIHAPASGGAVRTESMNDRYWSRRLEGARRIEQR
jgi:cell wall-associated NlpC family hydrolase